MSYIDTFDHVVFGFFAGLVLYHLLETVDGSGGDEFGCTPMHLVLGGGSGEHPAMVPTNPAAAVMAFLEEALPADGPPLPPEAQDDLDEMPPVWACLHFAGWLVADFVAFHERCCSPALVSPCHAASAGALESWVLRNVGEFVYFSMPELAPQVPSQLSQVCDSVRVPRYFNVLIMPPGYDTSAGRSRGSSGEVIWDNYAWSAERRRGE